MGYNRYISTTHTKISDSQLLERDIIIQNNFSYIFVTSILNRCFRHNKIINLFISPGTPGLPVIMVNVTEVESSRYQIGWSTPSFTHIAEHLLIYKQVKVIIVHCIHTSNFLLQIQNQTPCIAFT